MSRLCLLFFFCLSAQAKVYNVGPNYPSKTLARVPWSRLSAGDIVNIYASPGGCYAEKILISTQGKSWERAITVQGVLDEKGNRPCITGKNAKQAASNEDRWSGPAAEHSQSGYVVAVSLQEDAPGPQYVVIRNLEITGAVEGETYTADDGRLRQYGQGVAGIRLVNASHVRIENCWIHEIGGNGVFAKPNANFPGRSADIQLLNNRFNDNGVAESLYEHNTYIEADGAIYCGNLFQALRPGARGAHLKDRSAGTVVAHNYFDGNATRYIDLVEAQDGWPLYGSQPYYGSDFVFGNVFRILAKGRNAATLNTPIHYGGDVESERTYRNRQLSFYHNTVVLVADRSDRQMFAFIQPAVSGQVLDLRNNIFAFLPATPGAELPEMDLLVSSGDIVPAVTVNFGVNWINTGWYPCAPQGKDCFLGTIEGTGNLVTGADPKFADVTIGDFTLAPGSPALGTGKELSPLIARNPQRADYTPTVQYAWEHHTTPRTGYGAGADLGALLSGTPRREKEPATPTPPDRAQ